MKKEDWAQLPKELQDFIWDNMTEIHEELWQKYSFSFEQAEFVTILVDKVILQIISPLDIVKELEGFPQAKDFELRELALDLATKVFAPMKEYIDNVDRLILRLGGKIPKTKPLKRKSQSTDHEFVDYAEGNIKNLLKQYKNLGEKRISSNKIINKEGRKISPNIDNWIKDYIHFLGAGHHTSLQRAMYLSKQENALKLSFEDRMNLRFLLVSYDEGTEYSFEKTKGLVKISEIKKISQSNDLVDKKTIDTFFADLKNNIKDLEEKLIPGDYLLSEVDNDLHKVRNLLWDSIGLMDREKAISCIYLMLERKSFDNIIKEDSRFASILKRFLNIKYGKKLDNFVDKNIDKLMFRRLFLEMILADKLQFKDQESQLVAFYLSGVVDGSGQIVYLDKSDFKLKWREVQLVGENLAWLDDIK